MNSFLQFELWKDCNNKCKFCFNDNSSTPIDRKYKRIDFILNELDNVDYSIIDRIGFIGGEFFDNQMDSQLTDKFITMVNKVLDNINVKKVLITASLIYKNDILDYVLSKLHNIDKLMICTSWDTMYRFHNQNSLKMWEDNVYFIHNKYNIDIHVEIIPTQYHIEDVINNRFNIIDFERKYNVTVDYTDLNSGFKYNNKYDFQKDVPNFFPKRVDFIKFLYKIYTECQATKDKLLNFDNMSYFLWFEFNGEYKLFSGYRGPLDGIAVDKSYPLPPMHEDKSDYIDSNIRMRKDIIDVWENIYG